MLRSSREKATSRPPRRWNRATRSPLMTQISTTARTSPITPLTHPHHFPIMISHLLLIPTTSGPLVIGPGVLAAITGFLESGAHRLTMAHSGRPLTGASMAVVMASTQVTGAFILATMAVLIMASAISASATLADIGTAITSTTTVPSPMWDVAEIPTTALWFTTTFIMVAAYRTASATTVGVEASTCARRHQSLLPRVSRM